MTAHATVNIGSLAVGNEHPFVLIAGPCQIESAQHATEVADALHGMATRLGIGLIYKSSFDKANRTSINGARGVGMAQGLDILAQVRARFGMPVLTDVHQPEQCAPVAEVADVLQIPAFLCRQTDLLLAAGQTGAAINIKKGQFLAPWDMANVAVKVASTGNERIMLCERGTSFGYNTLVNDMRALPIMAGTGYPVIYDATHSVQQPGGLGSASGGQRVFAPILARAALAIGVAGLFIETHPDPDTAPSDGATMLPLSAMEDLLGTLLRYDQLTKQTPPDEIL
ncbi:3-deoxy-8-phosphooctulonate synthase [Komagataeibacter nataicola]|uniref:2-dehydro-3-deoxyphosphooctonate aldolase n=1 Tax=Komagataeibacter nataicola TaxID=265960 RepID=A0A9N7CX58_9PROT|nr:3-deoxy-8-phosphooctulonate synthase [Komagataeibacter nataicola]AQU86671.1 3-deoxy-8-phosphooctulonate synthase [Komagataeibacter nataicola]PYD66825.1 3-deoxy-8-phosphooctulonate synthase [Komagataeibacter nataicola]WEQ56387.1 3-deoxy-8-phosphooctulonate synthase [Komagataeibacter nataicola]WNM07947.1 3-deoxy-8-phosphooctulonate synthase [Komagataeibacter nataicola]GBR22281.1 3-deoxy-8-phosphooctulonate synthase [Komagataeibacter nataicola NRIC 0616]